MAAEAPEDMSSMSRIGIATEARARSSGYSTPAEFR
jgi:hypothetical protein